MKRTISTLVLLTILLLLSVSALAQDDATAVPTDDVPAATQEATALETEQAIATQEVVVIVTQTPEQSPTPTLTPTPEMTAVAGTGGDDGDTGGTDNAGSNDPLYFLAIGVLIVVLAFGMLDRWTNYQLSKKAISQIPPEWLPFIQKGIETAQKVGYEKAGSLVQGTPQKWDDNLLNEQMKNAGWEFYTAADGVQHARKIVAPAVSPQG